MGDEFNISNGNLEVLKRIPEMMAKPKWRKKLRRLVIDYTFSDIRKRKWN